MTVLSTTRLLLFAILALFVPLEKCSTLAFQPRVASSLWRRRLCVVSATDETTIHPAVEGWPEKYSGTIDSNSGMGPRILSPEFQVIDGTDALLNELDVNNWPTWTTADKEKWAVGNQNKDKIMPYGELSYVLEGRLEIIPADTGVPVIIEPVPN